MKILLKQSVLLFAFVMLQSMLFSQSSWQITLNNDTEPFYGEFNKEDGIVFKFKKRTDFLHFTETKASENIDTERMIIIRPKGKEEILFEIPLKKGEINKAHFHVNRVYHILDEEYRVDDQKFEIIEVWDGGEKVILTYTYI